MTAVGPQADRQRQFFGGGALGRIGASVGRSTEIAVDRDFDAHSAIYDNDIRRLTKDNEMLKDQCQRLSKELKVFQIKFPSAYSEVNDDMDAGLPPWCSMEDVVTPLMTAYDLRLKELEETVANQSSSLKASHELISGLVAENEELKLTLVNSINSATAGHSKGTFSRNINSNPVHNDTIYELNERVEILMAENALLIEHKSVLVGELEEHHSELVQRTQECADSAKTLSTNAKEIQSLKYLVEQTEKDRDEAGKQAIKFSNALSKADTEIESMGQRLSNLMTKFNDQENTILQLNKVIKAVEASREESSLASMRKMKVMEDRVRELHIGLVKKTHDLDDLSEVHRKLKREYQATRQDAEGMLQVMSGLEKQINDFTARESEVEQLVKDYKLKLEEALSVRDQLIVKEEYLRKEIERLLEERKLSSQRYGLQLEEAVSSVQRKAAVITQNYEGDTENLAKMVADLRLSTERANHESRSLKEQLDQVARTHIEERGLFEVTLKGLFKKINELTLSLSEECKRRVSLQDTNKELRSTVDKLRTQAETIKSSHTFVEVKHREEVERLLERTKKLDRAAEDQQRVAGQLQKELEDLQMHKDRDIAALEITYKSECDALKKRLQDTVVHLKDLEGLDGVHSHEVHRSVDQIKLKTSQHVAQLETLLHHEMGKANSLLQQNRELQSACDNSVAKNSYLTDVLEEAKQMIVTLQGELQASQAMLFSTAEQLSYDVPQGNDHGDEYEDDNGNDNIDGDENTSPANLGIDESKINDVLSIGSNHNNEDEDEDEDFINDRVDDSHVTNESEDEEDASGVF